MVQGLFILVNLQGAELLDGLPQLPENVLVHRSPSGGEGSVFYTGVDVVANGAHSARVLRKWVAEEFSRVSAIFVVCREELEVTPFSSRASHKHEG